MIDLAAALGIPATAGAPTPGSTGAGGDFAQALVAAGIIADAEGSGGKQAAPGDTEGISAEPTGTTVDAADETPADEASAEVPTPTTDDAGAATDRPTSSTTDLALTAGSPEADLASPARSPEAELPASPAGSPEAEPVADAPAARTAPLHPNVNEGSATPASATGTDPAAPLPTTDDDPRVAAGLDDAVIADRAGVTATDPAGSLAAPSPTDAGPRATDAGATTSTAANSATSAPRTTTTEGTEAGVSAVVDPAPGEAGPPSENTPAPQAPTAGPVGGPITTSVDASDASTSIGTGRPVATTGATPAPETAQIVEAPASTPRPGPATVAPTTAPTPMTDVAAFVAPTTADASPLAAAEAADTAPAPAPAGGRDQNVPAPAQQIAEALREVRRLADGTHRLSLQLQPRELGTVQLEIALRDGQLHLHAVAERDATARTLEAALPELRGELRDAGVEAGSLEVRDHGTQSRERERNQPDRAHRADQPVPGDAPQPAGETDRPDRPSTSTLVDVRI